jgi:hypothetical protein
MNGIKVNVKFETAQYIIYKHLLEACSGIVEFVDGLADDVANGKASLWRFDSGWGILSVVNFENQRFLFVHCLEGKSLLNGDGYLLLYQIALLEGCIGVMCESKKRGVQRLLKRAGFELHQQAFNSKHYESSGLLPLVKRFF